MTSGGSRSCLRLGIAPYMPYMYVEGPDDDPIVRGSLPAVLDIIFNHLGYCYEYVVVPSRSGGIRLPNGSWTGFVKMLLEKEVDMSGVPMALTHDRFQDVEATEFLYIDGWSAGFRRPVLQSDVSGFVKPFSAYVWLFIAAAILGVLATIWFVYTSHETIANSRDTRGGYPGLGAFRTAGNRLEGTPNITKESVLWTVALFLSQSVTKTPRGNSVRVITGVWLLVSLILNTVYRSNLKAMLILPKVVLPFDSPEELAETGIPTWIPMGSAMHTAALKSPPGSAMARVLQHSISLDTATDVPWGVRDMVAGKHAMISPRGALIAIMHDTFSKTGQCPYYVMSEDLIGMVQLPILLRKDSPLKAELDPIIRRLREFGILDHEYRKQVANATECLKPIGSQGARQLRPLDLGDFYGVFMLYAGGALMALISFAMELLMSRTKQEMAQDHGRPSNTAKPSVPPSETPEGHRISGLYD